MKLPTLLLQAEFDPLTNTATTAIRPDDLLAFIADCGHQPLIFDFDAAAEAATEAAPEAATEAATEPEPAAGAD